MATSSHSRPAAAERAGRELLAVLKEQADLLRRVERHLAQTRQALASHDLAALQAATAATEAELKQQHVLEQRRRACVQALAAALGEPPERLTLARIVDLDPLSPELRRSLGTARRTLQAHTTALAAASRRNGDLLRSLLRLVGDSLAFLQGLRARRAGYAADGRPRPAALSARVLDHRV